MGQPIVYEPGTRFGKLTILELANTGKQGYIWKCRCDCGKEIRARGSQLRNGTSLSCGCTRGKPLDLTKQRFGRLVAQKVVGMRGSCFLWECLCDCGGITIVKVSALRSGHTTSCGCFGRERRREAVVTHGMSRKSIHNVWHAMRQRCNNPKCKVYKNYGGRGIKVCEQWDGPDGFAQFLKDVGERPDEKLTLDRIDNDGNYEPSNVRWATRKQQSANSRRWGKAKPAQRNTR